MSESPDDSIPAPHDKLIELAQAGDKEAFTTLFNHYVFKISSYILGMGIPLDSRDDLLQDIFFKAWRELPALQQISSFKSWLYRLATNVVYDYHRKGSRKVQLLSLESCSQADQFPDPSQDLEKRVAENELVRLALQVVPWKCRMCLLLEIEGKLCREDIADAVEISLSSVGTYISNARRCFRDAYNRLSQLPEKESSI